MGTGVFLLAADDFKIYYPNGKSGYTSSPWTDYSVISYDPASTYTLSYNANGGATDFVDVDSLHTGDTVVVPEENGSLVYDGYLFDVWNTSADGTGVDYYEETAVPVGINNITLYAQWKTAYKIDIDTLEHGSITADRTLAAEGDEYLLTITPDDGWNYIQGTLGYKDPATGATIAGIAITETSNPMVKKVEMPASDVLVTAKFVEGDFVYETTGSGIKITQYVGSGGDIVIPSSIDGKTVTTLGTYSFLFNNTITSVTIPSTVTSIEDFAIFYCGYLVSVYFEGDAPVLNGEACIAALSVDCKIYYYEGSTGFTSPTWSGYPSVALAKPSSGGRSGRGTTTTPPAPTTTIAQTPAAGNAPSSVTATTNTEAKADSNGNAATAVTESQMMDAINKAVDAAAEKGGNTQAKVEIKVTAPANAKSVETTIPKAAFAALASGKTDELMVSTPIGTMNFDADALSKISGEMAGDVRITASKVDSSSLSEETKQTVGDRPVFNFSVTSGNKTISQFGGNVTVSVPYTPKAGEDTNAIVIYYINAEGEPEMVSDCKYDSATGSVIFTTNHFSLYAVGYNEVSFNDVAVNAWYSDAVSFIAARGITTGTGSGTYSPKSKITRGQFLVMVMRAYDIAPDENLGDNFADAGNTYYTGYLAAAKSLGITDGIGNNMFAPKKEITRRRCLHYCIIL